MLPDNQSQQVSRVTRLSRNHSINPSQGLLRNALRSTIGTRVIGPLDHIILFFHLVMIVMLKTFHGFCIFFDSHVEQHLYADDLASLIDDVRARPLASGPGLMFATEIAIVIGGACFSNGHRDCWLFNYGNALARSGWGNSQARPLLEER